MLAILVVASNLQGGVFLLDEFENGLHYSSMDNLWSALLAVCKEKDIQLFVTTHSYECIGAFLSRTDDTDDVTITRLERNPDNTHTAVAITREAAKNAVEESWELR